MKWLPCFVAAGICAGPLADAQESGVSFGLKFLYKADANQDGDITRRELKDFRSREFHRADRDGDGVISLKDVPARLQSRMKDRFENSEIIAAFDANKDGEVSRREFEDGPTLIFDHADADKDGTITQAELIEARTAAAAE